MTPNWLALIKLSQVVAIADVVHDVVPTFGLVEIAIGNVASASVAQLFIDWRLNPNCRLEFYLSFEPTGACVVEFDLRGL